MKQPIKFALLGAILVLIGVIAGFNLNKSMGGSRPSKGLKNDLEKLQSAVVFVEDNYVDEPDEEDLIDNAIKGMLEGLDPHSFYIPAKDMEQMDEQMQGSFMGIGVEFNLQDDTILVVSPVSGGPSDKLGIQAGDRIVKIDGEDAVGFSNNDVMTALRGPKGSKVEVDIFRRGTKKLLKFTIERDRIPLYSVDFAYMIRPKTGYIKVSRFAETTYDEFREAVLDLKETGMEEMVLDLRGNPGGVMQMAEWMADEFLSRGKTVVYTEGRSTGSDTKYIATSDLALFEKGPLVVLIDYGSASASEIVSGAVQDHDRGLIVGTRSFGKGLVQTQHRFTDGSALRLVISKYFTPSGRCIQKPYGKSDKEYAEEIYHRFESGEIYDPSKVEFPDSLKYNTTSGRTVYGGGAIMPDVFVPTDTSFNSEYMTDLVVANAFRLFAFDYADHNPEFTDKYKDAAAYNKKFQVTSSLEKEFLAFAADEGVAFNEADYQTSRDLILNYVKAFIGRRFYGDEGFYPTFHKMDNVIQRGIELMPKAKELEKTGKLQLAQGS